MYILDTREGVSGDMILSAFIDTGLVPLNEIKNIIEIAARTMDPTAKVIIRKEAFEGESGTTLNVLHWNFDEVKATSIRKHLNIALKELQLLKCRQIANSILDTILTAESKVHNISIEDLHLHETGSPDTLVDIIGTSHIITKIEMDIKCTSIAVGKGKVTIVHGIFDVPPPATDTILQGLDWFKGPYDGEMATPTGTAILKNIIKEQVKDIDDKMVKIGTGFGMKIFSGKRTAVRLYKI